MRSSPRPARLRSLATAVAVTSLLASALLPTAVGGAAQAAGPVIMRKATPAQGWETPAYAQRWGQDVGEQFSSPAVGDVDGDGQLDVVAGFPDGTVQAWRLSDGVRWFSFQVGTGAVQASPTLADLDGDGVLDILSASTGGQVVGVRTRDKAVLFKAATVAAPNALEGVFATPVVTDLDQDGRLEVVVTGWDRYLHVWDLQGQERPGFPVFFHDTAWSSPVIGDIDGDGFEEIVFGFDCDGVPGQWCYPQRGGYVTAVRHDGSWQPGWPRLVTDQVVWSTPALADLNGDGALDVVVGTGNMPSPHMAGGQQVLAYDGAGRTLPGWPVPVGGKVTSSPAVGDLDLDGRPEVAVVAEDGFLYVINGNGQVRWKRCISNDLTNCADKRLHASPSIGDVSGDGRQEVVVGGEQWMDVFSSDGAIVARGESYAHTNPMTAAPALVDTPGGALIVTASGTPDFSASGGNRGVGRVFAWETGKRLGRADWPTFKQSTARTGLAHQPSAPSIAPRPDGNLDQVRVDERGGMTYVVSNRSGQVLSSAPLDGVAAGAAAVARRGDRLDVVVRSPLGRLYSRSRTGTGAWTDWTGLTGRTFDDPALIARGDVLHLAVRGTDGRLYRSSSSGTGWTGWTGRSAALRGGPALALDDAGVLQVVVTGTDLKVWQTGLLDTGGWTNRGGAALGRPAVANRGSSLDIVVRGTNSRPYVLTVGSGGWRPLPGRTASSPSMAGGYTASATIVGTNGGRYGASTSSTSWPSWVRWG